MYVNVTTDETILVTSIIGLWNCVAMSIMALFDRCFRFTEIIQKTL